MFRRQYIKGECTHEEYYDQLVSESNAKKVVLAAFSVEELSSAFEKTHILIAYHLVGGISMQALWRLLFKSTETYPH